MKFRITEEKDAKVLSRKEVKAEIEFDATTPSRGNLRKRFASSLKVPEENVIVITVDAVFGEKKATVLANVYDKVEDIKKVESKSKRLDSQLAPKEEPKKEEAPKEAAPAGEESPKAEKEAPAEEKEKAAESTKEKESEDNKDSKKEDSKE